MNRKKLFIGIGAAAAVVVVAVIAFFMIRAGRGYRDITVFDISGTVKAVREGKTLSVAKIGRAHV